MKRERVQMTTVGCCLTDEQLGYVDAVAAVLSKETGNRAGAIRTLITMGWKAWTNRDKS